MELSAIHAGENVFESVYRMELVGMPHLKDVVMKSSFKCLQSAFVNKAGVLDDLAKIEQLKRMHETVWLLPWFG